MQIFLQIFYANFFMQIFYANFLMQIYVCKFFMQIIVCKFFAVNYFRWGGGDNNRTQDRCDVN